MYSKYQIAKAQSISLLDYIESRGYELIYSHNEVRLKEHDSLVISNNKWKWFSRNVGGGALDFLIEYEGKGFKEAMQILLGEKGIDEKKPQFKEHIQKQQKIKEISELPEKNVEVCISLCGSLFVVLPPNVNSFYYFHRLQYRESIFI